MHENKIIDLSKEESQLEKAGRLHWFHWAVIVLSLILTLFAWSISKKSVEEKIALQFERQATHVLELILERMQKYGDGLWAGVAAIQAKGGSISYQDWVTFTESFKIETKYPGINGIGVIHFVTPDKLDAFLSEQRKTRPDFRLFPEHNRNEYWPITYIEPLESNHKAVGLDMAHESNRYIAGVKARDTGKAQITGPIVLVQDAEKTPGFLFYAPFYKGGTYLTIEERREHFTGLVYAPFVVNKLMEGTLQKEKRQVGIKILDENSVLYDEHIESNSDFDPNPLFREQFEVDLYGRKWVFDIRSMQSFREASNQQQPLIILIGGIIIDALLITLFILLANTNARAIQLINKVKKE